MKRVPVDTNKNNHPNGINNGSRSFAPSLTNQPTNRLEMSMPNWCILLIWMCVYTLNSHINNELWLMLFELISVQANEHSCIQTISCFFRKKAQTLICLVLKRREKKTIIHTNNKSIFNKNDVAFLYFDFIFIAYKSSRQSVISCSLISLFVRLVT